MMGCYGMRGCRLAAGMVAGVLLLGWASLPVRGSDAQFARRPSQETARAGERPGGGWYDEMHEWATEYLTLQVGLRAVHTHLLADRKGRPFDGSFIGSIYGLDVKQDYVPFRPFAQVLLEPGIGLGMSFDRLRVATVDGEGGDGDVIMGGYYYYIVGQYRNDTPFTPYGEMGVVYFDNRFSAFPQWHEGGLREFVLKSSLAPYLAAGCHVALGERWFLDVNLRYVSVDVDGTYIFRGDDREPKDFVFTMEHLAFGLGVGFQFP